MEDSNINLVNYDHKNTINVPDTMFSNSYLLFINTPTRVNRSFKNIKR